MRLYFSLLAVVALAGFAAAFPVDSGVLPARRNLDGSNGVDRRHDCPNGSHGCAGPLKRDPIEYRRQDCPNGSNGCAGPFKREQRTGSIS
ncbi:hypothetical protein BD414DRAFT_538828 [Trametes punicea]|nr:hypothetical protein BD414DRAFT_538828 [Trametes punicea]